MTKTNEINGTARVTRVYSTLNGVPWETSAAELSHRGNTYTWISEKVGSLELFEGQEVYIKAFVRGTNRLYKVTISPAQPVPHSETHCAICTRVSMQNSRYCSLHDPAPFARAVVYGKEIA